MHPTLPEYQRVREMDRERFHPKDPAKYQGTIGIEGPDGHTYCVGCCWCEPVPSVENQRRIARVLADA